jgi:hypothetical protein
MVPVDGAGGWCRWMVPVDGAMQGQTGAAPSSPRACRAPYGFAPLALRSGALTARPRPG